MQEAVTAKEVQLTSYDDNVVHNKSGSGNNQNKNNNKDNKNNNNDTDNQANIEVSVTFCSHVGCNGMLVMCFSLVMASLFFTCCIHIQPFSRFRSRFYLGLYSNGTLFLAIYYILSSSMEKNGQ